MYIYKVVWDYHHAWEILSKWLLARNKHWYSIIGGYVLKQSVNLWIQETKACPSIFPPYLCKDIFGIKLEAGCASLLMLRFDKGASQFLKLQ